MAYTRQNYRMTFFGCNASYATPAATNPSSVAAQAVFKRNFINDSDANDFEESQTHVSVSFDLLAVPATTVTVAVGGGVTVTHAQLAALLRKASEQAAGL